MSEAFVRTVRAIDSKPSGVSCLKPIAVVALLAAWAAWLFLAPISAYESSEAARVELVRAAHPFDAPIAGRVVKTNFALDDDVQEGDALLELDAEPQRLALAEVKAKVVSITPQLAATRAEFEAEERALATFRDQGDAILGESTSRAKEAEIAARLAREELERTQRLTESGAVPEIDAIRARAEAERKAATESALLAQRSKLEGEWITGKSDRNIRIAALRRDAAHLQAELVQLNAQLISLEHEIERRRIRAPASGRVGEISKIRAGSFVDEGDHLGTIVARGDLRIVAEFTPAASFGRIHTGQAARIRFDGFPWTEFGLTEAQVADVAREVRDGHARVELNIVQLNHRIPVQHGLTGNVEIEIEHTTPAQLVLRVAGRLLHRPGQPFPEPPPVRDRRPRITRQ